MCKGDRLGKWLIVDRSLESGFLIGSICALEEMFLVLRKVSRPLLIISYVQGL